MKGSPGLLVPVPMRLLPAQSLRHAFPSYRPAGKCGAQQGIRAGLDAAPDSMASVTGSGMDARTSRACKMRLDFAELLEESALEGATWYCRRPSHNQHHGSTVHTVCGGQTRGHRGHWVRPHPMPGLCASQGGKLPAAEAILSWAFCHLCQSTWS